MYLLNLVSEQVCQLMAKDASYPGVTLSSENSFARPPQPSLGNLSFIVLDLESSSPSKFQQTSLGNNLD